MKYFKNLKTSERISLSFSVFGVVSLLLFMFFINATYFLIWYQKQKSMSFSEMNSTYQSYLTSDGKMEDVESFKTYLLTQDTIIIPTTGKLLCSTGVSKKIHEDPSLVKDRLFYKTGDTTYFIYSKNFDYIGEVKVLFDITPYITSQIIIIKTGLVFIFLVFILQFFAGKYISRRLLHDLTNISQKLQGIDFDSKLSKIQCELPNDDEIQILAETLNKSFTKIENQTQNLKQFITDVSHEFKTPLMSINSKIDVLEKKLSLKKEVSSDEKEFFIYMKSQTKKLNTLLETLFFLSRSEEGIQKLEKKSTDFSQYLESTCNGFFENHPQVEVKYNITPEVFQKIEKTTCHIIIENLLTNAVKFNTKKYPTISIGCNPEGFSISDNGIGITAEEKQNIYQKFYKKNINIEGFGIGLFLVKRILILYNWDIIITSQKEKGTKVTIKFT